ncbi:MAG: guanylate kinase [Gemmatimonadetes bacterium]|nr:guanylate kinase [Gemmatimonadota bacterium]
MKPFLLVLSAPSGGGKTTIARALLAAREDVGFSVSATTRKPRDGERDGIDYHFLSRDAFDRRVAAGEFLEWAEYGVERYGTLRSEVDRVLESGKHVVLDIEVQGAQQVRERCQNLVRVFIIPPNAAELVERLGGRNTEHPEEIVRRLRRAVDELTEAPTYDYVVVNSDRTQAVADVAAILDAEARRPARLDRLETTIQMLADGIANEVKLLNEQQES